MYGLGFARALPMPPFYPRLDATVGPPARAALIHCALRRFRYPPHALSHRETHPPSHSSSFPVEEHHRHLWYRPKSETQPLFLQFWAPSSYQVPLCSHGRVLGHLSLIIFLGLRVVNDQYKPCPYEWRIRPLHSLHFREYDGVSRNSGIRLLSWGATGLFWDDTHYYPDLRISRCHSSMRFLLGSLTVEDLEVHGTGSFLCICQHIS